MIPTINASATININDPATAQTSSFPYNSIGPVDFSHLNFIRTEQTDYYYSSSTTPVLVSEVKQIYDPLEALIAILGLTTLFFITLWFVIKKIKRF